MSALARPEARSELNTNMTEDPKFYNLEEVEEIAARVLPKPVRVAVCFLWLHSRVKMCGLILLLVALDVQNMARRPMITSELAQTQIQPCETIVKPFRGSGLFHELWSMCQRLT